MNKQLGNRSEDGVSIGSVSLDAATASPGLPIPQTAHERPCLKHGTSTPRPLTRRRFVSQSAMVGALLTSPVERLKAMAATTDGAAPAQDFGNAAQKPDELIRRMMNGIQLTQLIYIAAKLKIADHLANGPQPVTQLASVTETHADSLYRILRTLAGLGVFHEEEGRRFRLTPAAEILRSRVPGSLRAAAEARGEDWTWRAYGALIESVRTGQTGFDHVYGKNTFDWFAENPAAARIFDESQAAGTARSAAAVTGAYDFSAARVVVDVGGGNGTLLAAILRRYPAPRGILFDLPHVVDVAKPVMDADISRRCQFVGGDFFKSIPEGGDTYVMKYILHDWEESRARVILSNCHRVMAGRAKLLVVEDLVCGPNIPCDAKLGDVNMLARTGGRNRTEQEYRDLLSEGRFDVQRILPAAGNLVVIEAVPV